MGRPQPVALTPSDIASAQRRLLDNTSALIAEAELLCNHGHFARAFFLSVIATEEASKVVLLLECSKQLAAGQSLDWSKVQKKLTSHTEKLRANLLLFKSMRLGRVPDVGSAEWQDAIARVKEMDLLKQAAVYVWIGEGGPSTTIEHIAPDDKAHSAIRLAKLSYNASDLLLREFTALSEGAATVDSRLRYPT
jgi:AbiV family abortive infection protein